MSNNLVSKLFTQDTTREQFIKKYDELSQKKDAKNSSIFNSEQSGMVDKIFDTVDTNKDGKIDTEEIDTLKNYDNVAADLSEQDLKVLYEKVLENIDKEYIGKTPEQIYMNALNLAGSVYECSVIQDLGISIESLQSLINIRELNSQNVIAELNKKAKTFEDKEEAQKTAHELKLKSFEKQSKSLNKDLNKNIEKQKVKEQEIAILKQQIAEKQQELYKISPEDKEYKNKQGELNKLNSKLGKLNFELSNIKSNETTIKTKIKNLETEKENAIKEREEQKKNNENELAKIKNDIDNEKTQCLQDIEGYKTRIDELNKAQEYANTKLPKEGGYNVPEGDFHANDNALTMDELNKQGYHYNSEKGSQLAKKAASHAVGFTGKCSKYVNDDLEAVGLAVGRTGSAADMDTNLAKSGKFKELKVNSASDLKKLPAGCVLVYKRGAAGYSSKHGHIEITLGNGTAASDGVTRNLRHSNNMHVFVPV